MGLGDLLKKMFAGGAGSGPDSAGEGVDYGGYVITPAPRRHNNQYLTAGVITRETAEGTKRHEFVRADTHGSLDDAMSFSLAKGRQIVDEQGDRIFDAPRRT